MARRSACGTVRPCEDKDCDPRSCPMPGVARRQGARPRAGAGRLRHAPARGTRIAAVPGHSGRPAAPPEDARPPHGVVLQHCAVHRAPAVLVADRLAGRPPRARLLLPAPCPRRQPPRRRRNSWPRRPPPARGLVGLRVWRPRRVRPGARRILRVSAPTVAPAGRARTGRLARALCQPSAWRASRAAGPSCRSPRPHREPA